MKIPAFLSDEEYLQVPILQRFVRDHKIKVDAHKSQYVTAIEEYANASNQNLIEVTEWLNHIIREGSKEICFRKILKIKDWQLDAKLLESKIKEVFPDLKKKDVVFYVPKGSTPELINYYIAYNDSGNVETLELAYSCIFYQGDAGSMGKPVVYPVFVKVFLNDGFITTFAKAKSTLFLYVNFRKTEI